MICPQCGNDNPSKLKFCVKCGMNLENPSEVNYEQVDMGGYHAEEDSDSGKFSLGSGTFTISDNAQVSNMSSDLYTAEELNDDEEEFDFSSFDEPFIPKLDTDRLSLPGAASSRSAAGAPQMGGMPQQSMAGVPQMGGMPQQPAAGVPQMGGMPQQPAAGVPQMGGMPQQPAAGVPQMGGMPQQPMAGVPQMGGIPQQNGMPAYGQPMMYAQPQIVGYDQNGMPVYGQPTMYAQPQIVGYDQNGMPVYGQPAMYAQPQIMGYDQNGMPVYAQPAMYAQPQIMGYDQNGMPVYAQPAMYAQPASGVPQMGGMPQQSMAGIPQMSGIPQMGSMPQMGGIPQMGAAQQSPQSPQKKDDSRVDVPDDFWKFFDGGKSHNPEKDAENDFFGRTSMDAPDAAARRKAANKQYMSDTPLVDADKLSPNTASKYNSLLMRKTDIVNADELEAHDDTKTQDIMSVTREVDADLLNAYEHFKSRISMVDAGEADAEELEAYVPEHQEAIMSQNITAVDALPKKKTTYNDEIDSIELPEHMQARKTAAEDTPEIPGLPEM